MSDPLPRLKHVKFTRAKGKVYAYFNRGRQLADEKPLYMAMPRYGTDEFFAVYDQLLAIRESSSMLTYDREGIDHRIEGFRLQAKVSSTYKRVSYVYFIQSADGPIKIGSAYSVRDRLIRLQVANHTTLTLLGIAEGGIKAERALHARFKEHRIRGEWFHPHPDILGEAEKNK